MEKAVLYFENIHTWVMSKWHGKTLSVLFHSVQSGPRRAHIEYFECKEGYSQPRCLTSSAAGDECSSWLSMGLSGPWELQLPAMKVSFFKAHQRQRECSPISHHPPTVRRQLPMRLNPIISVNTWKIAVLMIHIHTQWAQNWI